MYSLVFYICVSFIYSGRDFYTWQVFLEDWDIAVTENFSNYTHKDP